MSNNRILALNIYACIGRLIVCLFLFSSAFAWGETTEIPLWAGGMPNNVLKHDRAESVEDKRETGRQDRWIGYVSEPTLTVYPAEGAKATGAAVLVIPGGGFRYVCIDKEGVEAAQWLNSLGITAAVLKYRVLDPKKERSGKSIEPIFADAARAMRVLRLHAADWKLDPKMIGVMGFSAGGMMSTRLLIDADAGDSGAADPVEKVSSRPDFAALIYSGLPPGKLPKTLENLPPIFIAHASDDPKAPAQAMLSVAKFVQESGGSLEIHFFREGGHGFGMQPASGTVQGWPTTYAAWLRSLALIKD